jgi:hypothetical protein
MNKYTQLYKEAFDYSQLALPAATTLGGAGLGAILAPEDEEGRKRWGLGAAVGGTAGLAGGLTAKYLMGARGPASVVPAPAALPEAAPAAPAAPAVAPAAAAPAVSTEAPKTAPVEAPKTTPEAPKAAPAKEAPKAPVKRKETPADIKWKQDLVGANAFFKSPKGKQLSVSGRMAYKKQQSEAAQAKQDATAEVKKNRAEHLAGKQPRPAKPQVNLSEEEKAAFRSMGVVTNAPGQ